ncbi:MAG TPA: ABC transporter substrate-binding protein [Oligoflexia bacterium]|nr:ABC transporter substrate-binding protein [Oligoflexia bacterium]HMR24890.1 ABC transporter substrate-binding protein [Oligoflexia bacterium]
MHIKQLVSHWLRFGLGLSLIGLWSCTSQFVNVGRREPAKKVFRVVTQSNLSTLHPSQLNSYTETILGLQIHEPLLYVVPETGKIVPLAAESYRQNFDEKSITFKLRSNLKWSNGQEITADDYVYAISYILNKNNKSPHIAKLIHIKGAQKLIEGEILSPNELGVKSLGKKIFKIEFEHFDLRTVMLFARPWTSPLRKINTMGSLQDQQDFSSWVGSGMFVPVRKNEQVILLRKNPYHRWASKIEVDEISVFYNKNLEQIEKTGPQQVHLLGHRGFSIDFDEYKMSFVQQGYKYVYEPDLLTMFLRLNNKQEILKDVAIRRAIAMSINRDFIKQSLHFNSYQAAYSMMPKNVLGYQPPSGFSYSKTRAMEELESLGYCVEQGRNNCKQLGELQFIYVDTPRNEKIALAMQQLFLNALPFKRVILKAEKQSEFDQKIVKGDFDMALDTVGALPDNAFGILEAFLPSRASAGSFYHIGFEKTLNKAFEHAYWSQVLQGIRQAEGVLLDSVELVPIFHIVTGRVMSNKLLGFKPNVFSEQVYSTINIKE